MVSGMPVKGQWMDCNQRTNHDWRICSHRWQKRKRDRPQPLAAIDISMAMPKIVVLHPILREVPIRQNDRSVLLVVDVVRPSLRLVVLLFVECFGVCRGIVWRMLLLPVHAAGGGSDSHCKNTPRHVMLGSRGVGETKRLLRTKSAPTERPKGTCYVYQ